MNVKTIIQQILDDVLLPYGVLSHHLRRVETDYIVNSGVSVNPDEYVVYRVVTNRPRIYGDGAQALSRVCIDVNYYYAYGKTDPQFTGAESRLQAVINAVLCDKHFRLINDITDISDIDNPYRGLNVEFAYFGGGG